MGCASFDQTDSMTQVSGAITTCVSLGSSGYEGFQAPSGSFEQSGSTQLVVP